MGFDDKLTLATAPSRMAREPAENAREIEVERVEPVRVGRFIRCHRAGRGTATRVVDQDIDAAMAGDHRADHLFDCTGVVHVGVGSNTHLTGELFQSMAKVKFLHVPYKGSGAGSADLFGGQVHLSFEPASTPIPHIRSGKLRAIAVTSIARSRHLPEIPTIDESGVRGFESTTSTVIALPAATPKDIVQKVRDALLVVLDQPRTRQTFEKAGGEVVKSTPDEYVRKMLEEQARWMRIRKETGIRLE
jgi:hypothetical protein